MDKMFDFKRAPAVNNNSVLQPRNKLFLFWV